MTGYAAPVRFTVPTLVPPVVHSPGASTLHRKKATEPAGVAVPPWMSITAESATASTPVPIEAPPAGTLAVVSGLVDVSVTTLGVVTVVDSQFPIGTVGCRIVSL